MTLPQAPNPTNNARIVTKLVRRYLAVRSANLVAGYRLHTTRAEPTDFRLNNTTNKRANGVYGFGIFGPHNYITYLANSEGRFPWPCCGVITKKW
jgi:hypothetical protein